MSDLSMDPSQAQDDRLGGIYLVKGFRMADWVSSLLSFRTQWGIHKTIREPTIKSCRFWSQLVSDISMDPSQAQDDKLGGVYLVKGFRMADWVSSLLSFRGTRNPSRVQKTNHQVLQILVTVDIWYQYGSFAGSGWQINDLPSPSLNVTKPLYFPS